VAAIWAEARQPALFIRPDGKPSQRSVEHRYRGRAGLPAILIAPSYGDAVAAFGPARVIDFLYLEIRQRPVDDLSSSMYDVD